jgi:hypothetical protein
MFVLHLILTSPAVETLTSKLSITLADPEKGGGGSEGGNV